MPGLLEVIALAPEDAVRAEAGGADRIELVGDMSEDGLSPAPELLVGARKVTRLPIRCLLRLRGTFSTDGGEATRLRGLAAQYRDLGADGLVLGFLNGHSEIDTTTCLQVLSETDLPWTFHRAVDATMDSARAWRALLQLGCDQVLTAGSPRGVEFGLDDLINLARSDRRVAKMIMVGGGLHSEHVPWLADAGVRAFHVGRVVRIDKSYRWGVDAALVRTWRTLIDASVQRALAHQEM